jgi:hypothetical protein
MEQVGGHVLAAWLIVTFLAACKVLFLMPSKHDVRAMVREEVDPLFADDDEPDVVTAVAEARRDDPQPGV